MEGEGSHMMDRMMGHNMVSTSQLGYLRGWGGGMKDREDTSLKVPHLSHRIQYMAQRLFDLEDRSEMFL
jgi:hypothetical protein